MNYIYIMKNLSYMALKKQDLVLRTLPRDKPTNLFGDHLTAAKDLPL